MSCCCLLTSLTIVAHRTLQFLVSPHIGALSDKHGRKRILLLTMIGNILSALVYVISKSSILLLAKISLSRWIQSTSFASYMLSRVIGGLSEGNVQLAMCVNRIPLLPYFSLLFSHSAILSDVTAPGDRSKALAHVGIAFAICFIIGPPIGAYFASQPVPASVRALGWELNVYAVPGILTLFLLVTETIFLAISLPETRRQGRRFAAPVKTDLTPKNVPETYDRGRQSAQQASTDERIGLLKRLRRLHFLFLCLFSGVEFTLTFLTFDRECRCLSLFS